MSFDNEDWDDFDRDSEAWDDDYAEGLPDWGDDSPLEYDDFDEDEIDYDYDLDSWRDDQVDFDE